MSDTIMPEKKSGLRVLDLYCGAGGFSEGFRQAGFDVVVGIDNWQIALDSHKLNGLGASLNYDMFKLIDAGGYEEAKRLAKEIQDEHGRIDVLIGSPPCTEFSYAKKGGHGDIEKGMLLVRAHLVMVAALQPKLWLMENVPRLKNAIDRESTRENSHGWYVALHRLGVTEDISDSELVDDDSLIVPHGKIYTASNYGAPQGRKRFIAGSVDSALVKKTHSSEPRTMGEIIQNLQDASSPDKKSVKDPNYPRHRIKRKLLRDYFYDTRLHPMYWEELRHLKRRHIQYGRMAIPDELDRPARTIMATSNPSSREAVTIDTGRRTLYQGKKRPVLRQPTVREVACIQGFPISFQFTGTSLNNRYKQIGNAVPCQLSRALALGMIEEFKRAKPENKGQAGRLQETLFRLEKSKGRPIIKKSRMIVDEASDFAQSKYMEFRAKPKKYIRRKLLSAKPFNTSAILVFENTDWTEDGKRTGGFWKSCIQLGQGKRFSQVYLDHRSVKELLESLNFALEHTDRLEDGQMTLEEIQDENRLKQVQNLCSKLMNEVDIGIPLVDGKWKEFPGYYGKEMERYLAFPILKRLLVPSADNFQNMFTSHVADGDEFVGPIDLFDGLDALMLHEIAQGKMQWVLSTELTMKGLEDIGVSLHKKRINPGAVNRIAGNLPLVTIIAAILSIHVLYRMHENEKQESHPMLASLRKAWQTISRWCNFDH